MKKFSRFLILAVVMLLFRYVFSIIVGYLFPVYIIDQDRVILNESSFISEKSPTYKISEIWGKGQSVYFANIAINGYEQGSGMEEVSISSSLYPLYPMLIRTIYEATPFSKNIETVYWIGALLSTFFFGAALFYLDKLLDLVWFHEEKKYVVYLLILFFPGSFFFNLVYSEALFLLLSILFLYNLFKKNYTWASVFLSMSIITRVAGVALIVPFFFHIFIVERYNKRFKMVSKSVMYTIVILLPLLVFYYHLFDKTGSFFGAFEAHQQTYDFLLLPLGYFFDLFMKAKPQFLVAHILNALVLVAALGILIFAFVKTYLAFEYRSLEQNTLFVYALVYTLMLSSVSSSSMMFRYFSVCLPIFILPVYFYNQTQMVRNKYFLGILFLFLSLQAMFFTLFITGIPAYGY